jgi:AraC-like DNA-binding protein
MPMEPTIRAFIPAADLQPFVRKLILVESPWLGVDQIIPAWTKPMLVLQYSDPVYSTVAGAAGRVPNITVNGMVSKRYRFTTPAEEIRLFLVEFTEIGAHVLFRQDATSLTDFAADATELTPKRHRRQICEALYEQENVDRKVKLVENFLRDLIPSSIPGYVDTVQRALKIMRASGFASPIQQVADEADVNRRSLRRSFARVTGLTPKTFSRIERFVRVYNQLIADGNASTRCRDCSLYYDQSHLIREFEHFTGYSPTQLPKERFLMHHFLTS